MIAVATANSVPIWGDYPGFVQGGNAFGIEVQLIYDSICTDSAAQNLVMNQLLQTAWRGAPVIDQIKLAISYTTLPYHYHSFQVV